MHLNVLNNKLKPWKHSTQDQYDPESVTLFELPIPNLVHHCSGSPEQQNNVDTNLKFAITICSLQLFVANILWLLFCSFEMYGFGVMRHAILLKSHFMFKSRNNVNKT